MIEPFTSEFLTPTKKFNELSVLLAIHDNPKGSQHQIAGIAHLSSSMVNNYMKRLQQEGLVSVQGETNRTMSYHLTSSGCDKLVTSFLSFSTEIIQFYAAAKRELGKKLNDLYLSGSLNIILFGAAETCELVLSAIKETKLKVTALLDSDKSRQGELFKGLRIQSPEVLKKIKPDAVIITSFGRQEEIYKDLLSITGRDLKIVKLTDLYAVNSYDSLTD